MNTPDTLMTTAQASPGVSTTLLGVIIVMLFSLIPAIIAFARSHVNAVPIALTGILFGWTLFGWGIALIWSFTTPTAAVAAVPAAVAVPVQAPAAKPSTGSKAGKFIAMTAAILVVIVALAMIFSKKPTQDQAGQQQAPAEVLPPNKVGVPVPAEELFGK